MRIDILSAVPALLHSPLNNSIVGRAKSSGLVDIVIHDLHDYSTDKHRKVDDYPYGGGAGMVLSAQPVFDCIEKLLSERAYSKIIYTSPDGKQFSQPDANALSLEQNLLFICGHYKGIDQRIRDILVTTEYSVGDVVFSGGELPVMLMIDAIVRLLPGALGDSESALSDAFQDDVLDAPHYTRPGDFRGHKVPDVLLSGDHKAIEKWRHEQAHKKTQELRPDLITKEY